LGVGLQFHFNSGAYLFVQAQWKMALTDGIKDDFMFYSIGFGQHKKPKKVEQKAEIPATDSAKNETKKDTAAVPKVNTNQDTDGDGILDMFDLCIDVKGTVNGCPDTDGDGVADKDDKCPNVKGSVKNNGCPAPDTDGDGVNDDEDNCPDVKGVKDNSGCPADSDGDGILDKDDKCPDAAGSAENNGCPMHILDGGKLIRSSGDSMTYFIRFDFDKANITSEAFGILTQIVNQLKADKTLMLNIEGHADNFGIEKYNILISQDRANVARDYLQSYGIARSRMKTAYYGSSRPYDIHQDWLNRRVEITIYKTK
jgi:outer membrane protein OmpA-like peptidoglycan-associated protein